MVLRAHALYLLNGRAANAANAANANILPIMPMLPMLPMFVVDGLAKITLDYL
jgi:hypothetical protein